MGKSKDKLESERINRNPQDKLETACSYHSLHLNLTTRWPAYKAGTFDLKVVYVPGPGLRETDHLLRAGRAVDPAAAGYQPSVSVDQLQCALSGTCAWGLALAF